MENRQMSRDEVRWLVRVIGITLLITTLPYLIGFQRQGSEWRFSGFLFGVEDGNSYLAKMLRGAAGEWLFRTPYTTLPQPGLLAFLPYLLSGKLSSPPGQHDQLVVIFQIFRWAAAAFQLLALYRFSGCFFDRLATRRLVTLLAAFGGGLGWLGINEPQLLWGERIPLDFYSPESFGFLALLGLPHLAFARGLLLWGLTDFLRAIRGQNRRMALRAGFAWLLLGFFQPITVVSGWFCLSGYLLVLALEHRWARCKHSAVSLPGLAKAAGFAMLIGLISSPMVLYTFLASRLDPFLRGWSSQNLILSPPPLDYLLAYLPVLPLGWFGLQSLRRHEPGLPALPLGYLILFPLLAYFPYVIQRRLPDGIWVMLTILFAAGLETLSGKTAKLTRLVLLPTLFLSSAIFLAGSIFTVWFPQQPLFFPADQVAAFTELDAIAEKDAVVLGAFATSNRLPAWGLFRTITGHGPESVGISQIEPQIEHFFERQSPDADRTRFLLEYKIQYLIAGPDEQDLGGWNPETAAYLQLVVHKGDYHIYQVQADRLQP